MYGQPYLVIHSCFSWKAAVSFGNSDCSYSDPAGEESHCGLAVDHVGKSQHATSKEFLFLMFLNSGWLLFCLQRWSLFTRDSFLVSYFQKINVSIFFPCISIECAHNHKEFRHPVTVVYSENSKCEYDFLELLVVKYCPFHKLSILQITEEKIFLCDSIVESYLYISPLLHYSLFTLTSYGMKSHGKGGGRQFPFAKGTDRKRHEVNRVCKGVRSQKVCPGYFSPLSILSKSYKYKDLSSHL